MKLILLLTLAATAVLTGCGGDGGSGTATPSATPAASGTTQPSATPAVEAAVGDAYLKYWDAYSAALLALDSAPVESLATGDQLRRIQNEIDGLRAQGVAERVVVEHHFAVIGATATTATVSDEIVNNSFFVDPVTKDPPSAAGNGERFTDTYQMEMVGDRWVVVNGSRQSSGAQ
jgi:hypothetical protein